MFVPIRRSRPISIVVGVSLCQSGANGTCGPRLLGAPLHTLCAAYLRAGAPLPLSLVRRMSCAAGSRSFGVLADPPDLICMFRSAYRAVSAEQPIVTPCMSQCRTGDPRGPYRGVPYHGLTSLVLCPPRRWPRTWIEARCRMSARVPVPAHRPSVRQPSHSPTATP